jgi:hypothetical protein
VFLNPHIPWYRKSNPVTEPLLFDIAAEPLPKTVDRVVCRGWESGTVADESGAAALPRTMGTSP